MFQRIDHSDQAGIQALAQYLFQELECTRAGIEVLRAATYQSTDMVRTEYLPSRKFASAQVVLPLAEAPTKRTRLGLGKRKFTMGN